MYYYGNNGFYGGSYAGMSTPYACGGVGRGCGGAAIWIVLFILLVIIIGAGWGWER